MKHTVAFIDAFCARHDPPLSAKEIAARMGLDPTVFAGWRRGKGEHVRLRTLVNMQTGLSDDPTEQARLLVEYLRDQCGGPGAERVDIRLRPEGEASSIVHEDATAYGTAPGDKELYCSINAALRETKPDWQMHACLGKLIRALPGSRSLRQILLAISKMREA